MASKRKVAPGSNVPGLDSAAPFYRLFKERPSRVFVDEVAQHVRESGEPETFDGLYRGKLLSDARYHILRKIDIDQKKRPRGDKAPCPMCSPNRFLHGYLVWLPDLQVSSVIGHCCADHADDAEREYKASEKLRKQEDYLLDSLPLLQGKYKTLQTLKGAAVDATVLYRKFRKMTPGVQLQLRGLKDQANAILRLTEVIDGGRAPEVKGYSGPTGFKGRGDNQVNSRDVEFGRLAGTTALLRNYRPTVELDDAMRAASGFEFAGDQEAALELIASMSDKERLAAVNIVQLVDTYYQKFIERIRDFTEFWSAENIVRLNAFGSSPLNSTPFEARRTSIQNRPVVVIRQDGRECRSVMPNTLMNLDRDWKVFTYNSRS